MVFFENIFDFDQGETNPCNADTDNDGLVDGNTGSEDLNANGIVDPGETDPANTDTDGDGIFDGTERGLTEPETADTDVFAGFFVADTDPSVNGLKKTHIFGEKRTSSPYVYVKSESC